jgi:outer membrane protein OmpA-like peptidoglycan-associated protein
VSSQPRSSEHVEVIRYLRSHGYSSVLDLAQALSPECFVGDDLAPRQEAIERLRARCAQLVRSDVLSTAYSPVDGEFVYCIREVFEPVSGAVENVPDASAGSPKDAQPAVFRRRGDAEWRGQPEVAAAIGGTDAGALSASVRSNYAVFFKLGTVLRPSCDLALRNLAREAAQALQIHVIGQESRHSGISELSGILASQRAAIVANRLVDFGIDRFRIELSVQPWDERPLAADVFAIDPPKSLSAQSRRVEINLRHA